MALRDLQCAEANRRPSDRSGNAGRNGRPRYRWALIALGRGWAAGAVLALAACADGPTLSDTSSVPRPPTDTLAESAIVVDTLATQLETPWGLAVAPDGRIFVTERPGRLRVVGPDGLVERPLLSLEVYAVDSTWHPESGLMGIALAPDFASSGHAYLYGTFRKDPPPDRRTFVQRVARRMGITRPHASELHFENRILRATVLGDTVVDVRTIVAGIPAAQYHAGGALAFGPDGMLYATVGDGRIPRHARDVSVLLGKILRYSPDGTIPSDNPIADSPVWAQGLRNAQGLAWMPEGALFAIEHGPSGLPIENGRTGHDELNAIIPGGDYGWPDVIGGELAQTAQQPMRVWTTAVAPAGLAGIGASNRHWRKSLFVGRLRGGVERLQLKAGSGGWAIATSELLPLSALRRIRSVLAVGDSVLLVTTSNVGVRGVDRGEDDLLVRVRLKDASHR